MIEGTNQIIATVPVVSCAADQGVGALPNVPKNRTSITRSLPHFTGAYSITAPRSFARSLDLVATNLGPVSLAMAIGRPHWCPVPLLALYGPGLERSYEVEMAISVALES